MISYELAKKLKDAGFPLTPCNLGENGSCESRTCSESFSKHIHECWCDPTLEEAIEACGDGYFRLEHNQIGWQANIALDGVSSFGKTPLEAVCNLWLELNKPVV